MAKISNNSFFLAFQLYENIDYSIKISKYNHSSTTPI
jgi:hypothetical protein